MGRDNKNWCPTSEGETGRLFYIDVEAKRRRTGSGTAPSSVLDSVSEEPTMHTQYNHHVAEAA